MEFPSIDIVSIVCGKEKLLGNWMSYLRNISGIFPNLSLIVVNNNNCPKFDDKIKECLVQLQQERGFCGIRLIQGTNACEYDSERFRSESFALEKHQSTASGFRQGINASTAKYIFTLDDDVIPPRHALYLMLKILEENSSAGAATGYYFNNSWPGVTQNNRTVCLSLDDQINCSIYQIWGQELFDVKFTGTGCALWRSELLKNINFDIESSPKEGVFFGPDVCMSRKIREAGYSILCHHSMLARHYNEEGIEAGIGVEQYLKEVNTKSNTLSKTNIRETFRKNSILSQFLSQKIEEILNEEPFNKNLEAEIRMNLPNLFALGANSKAAKEKVLKQIIEFYLRYNV